LLQDRGNDLIVVLGPFNRHIMTADNRAKFVGIEDKVKQWFESASLPYVAPTVLDSLLYGDASHPLAEGYRQLAESLWDDADFKEWLAVPK
jgi:lysophospholipase L1-like esterase